MKRRGSMGLAAVVVAGLALCVAPAGAQPTFEFAFSEFDLDSAPPDLERYLVELDLIDFFEPGFGAALEGGVVDPDNGVESFNFKFFGCLEQWDGVESETVSPVDCFWHGYGAQCTAEAQMLNLTDGTGIFGVVMRDFARAANVLRYDFETPVDIGSIQVWTEDNSRGIRAFMHYDVYYSTDGSLTGMTPLATSVRNGEFGITTNNAETLNAASSFTNVYDCTSDTVASGVTNLRFVFYNVGFDGGDLFVDPWRGYWHPDNSSDWLACEAEFPADPQDLDGRQKPFVASVVAEIDVLEPQPENAPGDFDGDGSVGVADFLAVDTVYTGPDGGPLSSAARPLDFVAKDCDVDLEDVAGFQLVYGT